MSTDTSIGPEANMLEPAPECARQIKLPSPILTNEELEKLVTWPIGQPRRRFKFKSVTLPMLFDVSAGGRGLESALDELCRESSAAIARGFGIIFFPTVASQMCKLRFRHCSQSRGSTTT